MGSSTSESANPSSIPIALPASDPSHVCNDTSGSSLLGHRHRQNQFRGSAEMDDGSKTIDRSSSERPQMSTSPPPNIPRARASGGIPDKSLSRSYTSGGDSVPNVGGIRNPNLDIPVKILPTHPTCTTSFDVSHAQPMPAKEGGEETSVAQPSLWNRAVTATSACATSAHAYVAEKYEAIKRVPLFNRAALQLPSLESPPTPTPIKQLWGGPPTDGQPTQ